MKKILTSLLFLATLATPSFAWDLLKMNETIEKTNVIVSGICSGTIVNLEYKLVLTAHHCITDNLREEIVKEVDPDTGVITEKKVQKKIPMYIETWKHQDFEVVSTERHVANVVDFDYSKDIALLQVVDDAWEGEGAAAIAAEIDAGYVYLRGKKIFAVGNPGVEFDGSVTEGIISAPQRMIDLGRGKVPFFQFSAGVIGGNSGGAIYSDDGKIVGTVSAGVRGSPVSFGVPAKYSQELIDRFIARKKLLP